VSERRRFPERVLAELRKSKILGIRSGTEHRFIGVWFVLVDDRVYVRSWGVLPDGWHAAFRKEPRGGVHVGDREIPARAGPVRSERVLAAVDAAYRERYHTPASLKYVRDLKRPKSRATTTELVPR
jgi:hypothetical protein